MFKAFQNNAMLQALALGKDTISKNAWRGLVVKNMWQSNLIINHWTTQYNLLPQKHIF